MVERFESANSQFIFECKMCDHDGCLGCQQFMDHLWETNKGRQAVYDRYCGFRKTPPNSPFKVCAWSETDIPLGICEASVLDDRSTLASIGVLVDPEYQRQGIATGMTKVMLEYLQASGITQIQAEIGVYNIISGSLASSLGASSSVSDTSPKQGYGPRIWELNLG